MTTNSKMLLAGTALLASVHAQSSLSPLPAPTLNNTLMNLTFSDPSVASCGNTSTSSSQIQIRTAPKNSACLNLDYIFTNPNLTYAADESFNSTSDGTRYTVTPGSWNPSSNNYSQVFYTQRRFNFDGSEDTSAAGALMVRAFRDEGCPGNGMNETEALWYSWDCQDEEGSCGTVPYSIKSILLSAPVDDTAGKKGCVKAEEFNGAAGTVGAKVGAVLMVGLGVVAAVML